MKQYNKKTDLILANAKNEADRARNIHQNRAGHHIPLNQGPYGHFIPHNMPGIMNKGNMPMVPPPMPNQGYPMMINPIIPPMGPNMPPNMSPNMPPNMGGIMNPNMGMNMGGMGKPPGI